MVIIIFCFQLGSLKCRSKLSKLRALWHVGCTLRNFLLSGLRCGIFNSKAYLLIGIDLHQTYLNSSDKKLIIRLSCQEFTRWFLCGCLRDGTFAEKENFSKRNYARSNSTIYKKITHIMLPSIFVQAQSHRNCAKAMCKK